jgi:hypothetical protein
VIGEGKFRASITQALGVLDDAGLLEARARKPTYPSDMATILRSKSYGEMWQACLDDEWYDCRLSDSSLVQFRRWDQKLSYSYLEAPYEAMIFEEYASERIDENWRMLPASVRQSFELDLRAGYELYLQSELIERPTTPLRYDYEPALYRAGVHPAGHIHFGLNNEIRVCTRRIFTPLSFTLFFVRQYYPKNWESVLQTRKDESIFREVREKLAIVPGEFMQTLDDYEHRLE